MENALQKVTDVKFLSFKAHSHNYSDNNIVLKIVLNVKNSRVHKTTLTITALDSTFTLNFFFLFFFSVDQR